MYEDIVSYDWLKLLNIFKIMCMNKSIFSERGRGVFELMSLKLYEICDEKNVYFWFLFKGVWLYNLCVGFLVSVLSFWLRGLGLSFGMVGLMCYVFWEDI